MSSTALRVGTSGFSFADWVGPVYPPGTPKTRMLQKQKKMTAESLTLTGYDCDDRLFGMPPG